MTELSVSCPAFEGPVSKDRMDSTFDCRSVTQTTKFARARTQVRDGCKVGPSSRRRALHMAKEAATVVARVPFTKKGEIARAKREPLCANL